MRGPHASRGATLARSTLLLALAPLLLAGGLDTHPGHHVGQAETPIFADARHATQAHHWEAVHSVRIGRCLACLAPAQPLEPPPASRRLLPLAGGAAVASAIEGRADPDVGRRRRPRGPPFS